MISPSPLSPPATPSLSPTPEPATAPTTRFLMPPAAIRIPKNATIKGDLVYFGDFLVGYIDPLLPKGMMSIAGPMVLIMEER